MCVNWHGSGSQRSKGNCSNRIRRAVGPSQPCSGAARQTRGKRYGSEGEGLHSQMIIAKSGSRYMSSTHRLNLELCLCRNLVLSFFSSVLLIFVIFKSKLTITDECV